MPKLFTLNNGIQVPWLAFGTGAALFGKDATSLIQLAIKNGITHLDGAQVYKNEETLGAGIKLSGKSRSELFVTTKLGWPETGETVKERLKASLAKLGVDYVDLFLVHCPAPANKEGKLKAIWAQMEGVQHEGLTRSIGVSNFRVEDLNDILETAKVIPSVNQIELHPYVYKAAQPILKLSAEKGITIASYGGLTPIVRVENGPLDPVLEKIRARLEKTYGQPVTTGQVLTKWILQKNAIVVTTTSKESRIKEFQDTENIPDLTAEEIEEIEEAGGKLHKRQYMRQVFGDQ